MEAPEEKRTPHSDITSFLILSNNHFAWRLRKDSLTGKVKFFCFPILSLHDQICPSKKIPVDTDTHSKDETTERDRHSLDSHKTAWQSGTRVSVTSVVPPVFVSDQTRTPTSGLFIDVRLTKVGDSIFDNTEVIFGEKQITAEDGSRKVLYTIEERAGTDPGSLFFRHQRVLPGTIDLKSFDVPNKSIKPRDVMWSTGKPPVVIDCDKQDRSHKKFRAVISGDLKVIEFQAGNSHRRSLFESKLTCCEDLLKLADAHFVSSCFWFDLVNLPESLASELCNNRPKFVEHHLDQLQLSPVSQKYLNIKWVLLTNTRRLLETAARLSLLYTSGSMGTHDVGKFTRDKEPIRLRDVTVCGFVLDAVQLGVMARIYKVFKELEFPTLMSRIERLLRKRNKASKRTLASTWRLLELFEMLPHEEEIGSVLVDMSRSPISGDHRESIAKLFDWYLRLNKVRLSDEDIGRVQFDWKDGDQYPEYSISEYFREAATSSLFSVISFGKVNLTDSLKQICPSLLRSLRMFSSLASRYLQDIKASSQTPYHRHLQMNHKMIPRFENGIKLVCVDFMEHNKRNSDIQHTNCVDEEGHKTLESKPTLIPMGRYLLLFYRSSGTQHTLIDTYTGRSVLVEPFPIAYAQVDCSLSLVGYVEYTHISLCRLVGSRFTEAEPKFLWSIRLSKERFEEVYHTPGAKLSMKELFSEPFNFEIGATLEIDWNCRLDLCGDSLMAISLDTDQILQIHFFTVQSQHRLKLVESRTHQDLLDRNESILERSLNTRMDLKYLSEMIHNKDFLLHVSPFSLEQKVGRLDFLAIKLSEPVDSPFRSRHTTLKLPFTGCTSSVKLFRCQSHSTSRGVTPELPGLCAVSIQNPKNRTTPIRVTVLSVNNRTGAIETLFDSSPAFHRRLQQSLESVGLYDTHPDNLLVLSDAEHRQHNEKQKHLNVYFCGMGYTQKSGAGLSMFERLQRTILVSRVRINL